MHAGTHRVKMSSNEEGYVVRIRGLPWTCTQEEVASFFSDCDIVGKVDGVCFTYSREGRPSGEAFIELKTSDDFKNALCKDRKYMGHRYIEVFKSNRSEMDWVLKRSGPADYDSSSGCMLRLRGLPFGCSKEEIVQFFSARSPESRQANRRTRAGEDPTIRAGETPGRQTRYIEIFKSSRVEIRSYYDEPRRAIGGQRPSPYDRPVMEGPRGGYFSSGPSRCGSLMDSMRSVGGYGRGYGHSYDSYNGLNNYGFGNCLFDERIREERGSRGHSYSRQSEVGSNYNGGHFVHMRGLPFRTNEMDIAEFFSPLNPMRVHIDVTHNGKLTGEADVEFRCHEDAVAAMSKDKNHMQHRYIELFLNSTASGAEMSRGGFYGNSGGGSRSSGLRSAY
ncbi:heterogeneous nuclear ribonucleoprotein H3 isoform X3 [Corythoichthys intestinalis]|uniref:heterogeneous nuclear ribonucleoprotein H3 isoform X3 n=1 Tax=Corythoichthys intestinalis TaxID=161448 RepID=UPI0025A5E654|nr:heterogeneous nuclear ribonucleoprotein H3 isoform X3 [Corythoichthys intestinalis]